MFILALFYNSIGLRERERERDREKRKKRCSVGRPPIRWNGDLVKVARTRLTNFWGGL